MLPTVALFLAPRDVGEKKSLSDASLLSAAAKHDFLKETFCSSFAERSFKLWRRLDEPAIIRPTVAATPGSSFIQGKH